MASPKVRQSAPQRRLCGSLLLCCSCRHVAHSARLRAALFFLYSPEERAEPAKVLPDVFRRERLPRLRASAPLSTVSRLAVSYFAV
eukprot:2001673-Pleurochrysis_carterae.AAC.2